MTVSVLRTESVREYHTQQTHYLYKKVTYDTPRVQQWTTAGVAVPAVYVGVLPANCLTQETIVRINTTFDGLLTVGTTSDMSFYASTADVTAGTADSYVLDRNAGVRSTVDRPVYVSLSSGSTVGDADIWLTYLPAK
jgi:hypothetical protein